MPAPIAVIVNRAAGAGYNQKWAQELAARFRAQGFEARVTLARSGAEIVAAAQRAVKDRVQTVVAGGGDGTINAVASALVGSDITLGVLALGTLNHFAKDLHIPLQLDDAVRNIIAGHSTKVDTGEVNGKLFLNNSSIGLYADLVGKREAGQRRWHLGKWPALCWAMIGVLRRYPFLQVRWTVDGSKHECHTPFVFIGNNQYTMNGFEIGERKRMNAGVLSVYIVRSQERMALLRLALRALCGRLRQAKDFETMLTGEITIETRHARKRVATDGEVAMLDAPLRYRIRPAALSVIVPKPSIAAGEE